MPDTTNVVQFNAAKPSPEPLASGRRVIVIGAGPVGMRFAQELLQREPQAHIRVFSNEPHAPYNRVQLSSLLAGQVGIDKILTPLPEVTQHPNFHHQICTIKAIDPAAKCVIDYENNQHPYDELVIATGSRPHVPNIPGIEQTGVYTFRSLHDTESLYSRVARSRHIVVVGGGLLGLEAARALLRSNTTITVIQQASRLMNRQLDDNAAALLQQKVESLGVQVLTDSGVRKIHGSGRVSGVTLHNGQSLSCDTVVLCAGIKTNDKLAREAGLKVARGIIINDLLQTSEANIYAIGECCEHRGETYGLVSPGFEQAAVLADILSGGTSRYSGSLSVSRLKVVGEPVCSMGEITNLGNRPHLREVVYQDDGQYRKLILHKNRLIGVVAIGEWSGVQRVQEAFRAGRYIWPWQQWRFSQIGDLWSGDFGDDPNAWPKSAIVCQCNNINQGQLVSAISSGNNQLPALQKCTGAGTVCGSCVPLLNELIGSDAPAPKEKAALPTQLLSLSALVIALLIFFLPEAKTSDSYLTIGAFEKIWNDKFWKQVTGFTLLGLSFFGLSLSLRKRLKKTRFGDFAYWRVVHITLGVIAAGTLILHTGFHLGANLNRLLIMDFLAILLLGSLAGLIVSLSHKLKPAAGKRLRKTWNWLHILVAWPLPMLLAFHIISVYYF